MKRMKSGFTLAEVLITLGIIGVVAAIVMPSVMTNYTYKTVGVKLSKFMSQLEGATRPYVVQNASFTKNDRDGVAIFVQESFLIKNSSDFDEVTYTCTEQDVTDQKAGCAKAGDTLKTKQNYALAQEQEESQTGGDGTKLPTGTDTPAVQLKDGTRLIAYPLANIDEDYSELFDADQVGRPVWGISFDPMVSGLPSAVNHSYRFVVTELGYVYPNIKDDCISAIYAADFQTNAKTFKASSKNGCVATKDSGTTNTGG